MKRRENLHRMIIKDHSIFPLLIISLIIITFSFDVSLLLVTLEKREGLKSRGRGEGGGGLLGLIFAGYVAMASQNPYPFIVNSVAKCRAYLSHS